MRGGSVDQGRGDCMREYTGLKASGFGDGRQECLPHIAEEDTTRGHVSRRGRMSNAGKATFGAWAYAIIVTTYPTDNLKTGDPPPPHSVTPSIPQSLTPSLPHSLSPRPRVAAVSDESR